MNLKLLSELLSASQVEFCEMFQILGEDKLFERSPKKNEINFMLGVELLRRYVRWRSENGIVIDFEKDIQVLLSNQSVREQLTANLFQHGGPTVWQLETVLDLLVLASYSRHITVNQTIKRRSVGAAPSPPGFSEA